MVILRDQRAVGVEGVPLIDLLLGIVNEGRALIAVAVLIEAVHLTVDLEPLVHRSGAGVEGGAVEVSGATGRVVPLSGYQLTVGLKSEGDVTVVVGFHRGVGGSIEVVPVLIDPDPTGGQKAILQMVPLAVHGDQTVFGMLLAAIADQTVTNDRVLMLRSGRWGRLRTVRENGQGHHADCHDKRDQKRDRSDEFRVFHDVLLYQNV